jgi:hypothetical protein
MRIRTVHNMHIPFNRESARKGAKISVVSRRVAPPPRDEKNNLTLHAREICTHAMYPELNPSLSPTRGGIGVGVSGKGGAVNEEEWGGERERDRNVERKFAQGSRNCALLPLLPFCIPVTFGKKSLRDLLQARGRKKKPCLQQTSSPHVFARG